MLLTGKGIRVVFVAVLNHSITPLEVFGGVGFCICCLAVRIQGQNKQVSRT
jgi:hypothetical protein